jgi:hypothetical protein
MLWPDEVWPQVGALSYAGQFNIMVVADRVICPDLDVFAASAQSELQALAATCASRHGTAGSPG